MEQPQTYLLAQSSDTLADKLMYVDERLTDIEQPSLPIQVPGSDTNITAVMRTFKGDNPEQQYEAGVRTMNKNLNHHPKKYADAYHSQHSKGQRRMKVLLYAPATTRATSLTLPEERF